MYEYESLSLTCFIGKISVSRILKGPQLRKSRPVPLRRFTAQKKFPASIISAQPATIYIFQHLFCFIIIFTNGTRRRRVPELICMQKAGARSSGRARRLSRSTARRTVGAEGVRGRARAPERVCVCVVHCGVCVCVWVWYTVECVCVCDVCVSVEVCVCVLAALRVSIQMRCTNVGRALPPSPAEIQGANQNRPS